MGTQNCITGPSPQGRNPLDYLASHVPNPITCTCEINLINSAYMDFRFPCGLQRSIRPSSRKFGLGRHVAR
ncbi:MAG: hypothetical protein CMJ96_07100 [Planctomycetes bacterium]|nr:hypothetical protein [Planctomycetota bacterium]